MPRYTIQVADRQSGQEHNVTLVADNPKQAAEKAQEYGMVTGAAMLDTKKYASADPKNNGYGGLMFISGCLFALGFISLGLGAIMLMAAFSEGSQPKEVMAATGLGLMISALPWMGFSYLLEVLRDIAIQTRK